MSSSFSSATFTQLTAEGALGTAAGIVLEYLFSGMDEHVSWSNFLQHAVLLVGQVFANVYFITLASNFQEGHIRYMPVSFNDQAAGGGFAFYMCLLLPQPSLTKRTGRMITFIKSLFESKALLQSSSSGSVLESNGGGGTGCGSGCGAMAPKPALHPQSLGMRSTGLSGNPMVLGVADSSSLAGNIEQVSGF